MVIVADLLPPSPVQERVKLMFPTAEIVTFSDPEIDFVPDHAPEAEQDEAFDDDQVSVESEPISTEVGSAEKLTIGAGTLGVDSPPPPPPPPPHEKSKNSETGTKNVLLFNIIRY